MNKLMLDFQNNEAKKYDRYKVIFKRILNKTFKMLEITDRPYIIETLIMGADEIQTINREYRGKDYSTDVISFAFEDVVTGEVVVKDATPFILGSILINAQKAESQAAEYGHSVDREFKFLFVHGLLHLLGYSHDDEASEQTMFTLQDKIIGKRGLSDEK